MKRTLSNLADENQRCKLRRTLSRSNSLGAANTTEAPLFNLTEDALLRVSLYLDEASFVAFSCTCHTLCAAFSEFVNWDEALDAAAENSHSDLFEWLLTRGCEIDELCCEVAASSASSNNKIINLIKERYMDANKFLLQGAMASGNLDLAKTLSPKPGEFLLYGQLAAAGGHLHILKWLEEQNFEHFEYLSQSAAKAGQVPILEWLTSINRCMITPNICVEVGLEGALDTLIWLKEAGHPWRDGVWGALEGGHIELLEWFQDQKVEFNAGLMEAAARSGQTEAMKWLHDKQRMPVSSQLCTIAARVGDLEMLKWLHDEKGCALESSVISGAARSMNYEIIEWARARGCPWDKRACEEAAKAGNIDFLAYLREHGCPWDSETARIISEDKKDRKMFEWLALNECPMDTYTVWRALETNSKKLIAIVKNNKMSEWLPEHEKYYSKPGF